MHHAGNADSGKQHCDEHRQGEITGEILRGGGDRSGAPAYRIGAQAQALQLRRQFIHERIGVCAGGQFKVFPVAHQAALLHQPGFVQVIQGNVNPRADQGKRQGFAGNLAQLAGDAKLLLADLDAITDAGVELQHHVFIDQRVRAEMKLRG